MSDVVDEVDVEVSTDELEDEDMRSPGWLPIIISSARTPKLYTSHFLVAFMV